VKTRDVDEKYVAAPTVPAVFISRTVDIRTSANGEFPRSGELPRISLKTKHDGFACTAA
jgi:hypothetical protein